MCGLTEHIITATIHGVCEFTVFTAANADAGVSCRRSFDKVLVLAATPQSSWKARIVNALLHIRSNAHDHPVFRVKDAVEQPAGPAPPDAEEARQTALTRAFASVTHLTEKYSRMCLEAAAWDHEKAKVLLQEKLPTLPDDAWEGGRRR